MELIVPIIKSLILTNLIYWQREVNLVTYFTLRTHVNS